MEQRPPANPLILDHEPGISLPSRDPFVGLKAGARGAREDRQPEAYSIWENQGKTPARAQEDGREDQAPAAGDGAGR